MTVNEREMQCVKKEGGERNKRSSSSNKGLQRKKLETVTLPVTQLTSPDRVKKKRKKKKKQKRRSGQEPGAER